MVFIGNNRVAVVGDEIFLRHLYIGASWLIHRARTIAGTEPEERVFLDSFDPEWVPRLRPMFQEIGRRLQLDFFVSTATLTRRAMCCCSKPMPV
jgi:hypothetical protein